MVDQRKLPIEYSVEELDSELVARAAQIPGKKLFKFKDKEGTPQRDCIVKQLKEVHDPAAAPTPNKALSHICTWDLIKTLIFKTGNTTLKYGRGIWYCDDRVDFYEIQDKQVKKNANCVAAICMEDTLLDTNRGFSLLKVKNFGKSFNLCDSEPFYHQPTAAGHMCTGFLVAEDVIATAAHFVNENNVTTLRIVFGYRMLDPCTPVTRIPNKDIYKGVKIVERIYNRMGNKSDWALVKLNRNVKEKEKTIAVLSNKDISRHQPVYVIGHPCGLPLKYAPGAKVGDTRKVAYFGADLDIYSGNSGSPVFDQDTHEVTGMVVRGDNRDFRWTGKGWVSVIYPNREIPSRGAQCTRASEFSRFCQ
jgi:V8-like Glu-specific endopeptidase